MKIPFEEEDHLLPKLMNAGPIMAKNELKINSVQFNDLGEFQQPQRTTPKISEKPMTLKVGDFEEDYEIIHPDGKTEIVQ